MLILSLFCRKHLYLFCLIFCSQVLIVNLCHAGTVNRQKKEEIRYVLPRDAIPAIKDPEFVTANRAGLDDNEPVIGITMNGESRAYSVYLLNHHEIVNDTIGSDKIAITWCPLANLAVVFSREISGKVYTFGVSGKLLKNTLVMFDYETESIWPTLYGEAVDGQLSGAKLKRVLMSQKMPWGIWKELHPKTLVLSYQETRTVGYDVYRDYHKSDQRGIFPVENRDRRLKSKMNVIGIEVNHRHKAYAFSLFEKRSVIIDEFEGLNLLIYRDKESRSFMAYDRLVKGTVVDFKDNLSTEYAMDITTGTTWDLRSGMGIKGRMKDQNLRRVSFVSVYWFVWADYYPDTEIFTSKSLNKNILANFAEYLFRGFLMISDKHQIISSK